MEDLDERKQSIVAKIKSQVEKKNRNKSNENIEPPRSLSLHTEWKQEKRGVPVKRWMEWTAKDPKEKELSKDKAKEQNFLEHGHKTHKYRILIKAISWKNIPTTFSSPF